MCKFWEYVTLLLFKKKKGNRLPVHSQPRGAVPTLMNDSCEHTLTQEQ